MVGRPVLAVTGATGFVGRRFIEGAVSAGYAIRPLRRRLTVDAESDAISIPFDLADPNGIDPALLDGVDAVVHLAAYIPRDQHDSSEAKACFDRNALGTLRLLQAARIAGVPRFVHTVSANAYTLGQDQPNEAAQMLPTGRGAYYLTSKIAQESFAAVAAQGGGPSVTALRLSSVYGASQTSGVILSFLRTLLAGDVLLLANDGRYGTDWVDVDDVVAAIHLVLAGPGPSALNVGSGIRVTLADMATRLADLANANLSLIRREPFDDLHDTGFPALNIDRIRALGYEPTPIRTTLARIVAAHC